MVKETEDLIISKELREKMASHYEVLDKVKKLLLIPDTEVATISMVSEFYEVGKEAISSLIKDNREEIMSDGLLVLTGKETKLYLGKFSKDEPKNLRGCFEVKGVKLNNSSNYLFPRRAILRVGMLLRDSLIAKEVRTQLLNIENKTTTDVKTKDINDEQKLAMSMGLAIASGDTMAIATATGNYIAFQRRYINKLQNDKKALAGEILEWKDRSKLNAGIRKLAYTVGIVFGEAWSELYKNLKYKYGIALTQRGTKPYINHIKEDEWTNVLKVFSAMCESYGVSATDMIGQTPHN